MRFLIFVVLFSFSVIAFAADPIVFKVKKPVEAKELQKKTPEERKAMRDKVKEFKMQFEKEKTKIIADLKAKKGNKK